MAEEDKCADCNTRFSFPNACRGIPMEKKPCYSKNCDGCANYSGTAESSKYAYSD